MKAPRDTPLGHLVGAPDPLLERLTDRAILKELVDLQAALTTLGFLRSLTPYEDDERQYKLRRLEMLTAELERRNRG